MAKPQRVSDNYEEGVRAGVKAFLLYFLDETGNSLFSDDLAARVVLQKTAEYAVQDALKDKKLYVTNKRRSNKWHSQS